MRVGKAIDPEAAGPPSRCFGTQARIEGEDAKPILVLKCDQCGHSEELEE